MLNPYFTQGTRSEQNLVQDLINEQLRMYGVDIYYIPRKYMTEKTVIREVVQSKFDNALPIEAYVDNYDAYAGAGDVLSKFGIESKDEVRLVISRERYENYITPLIQGQSNIKLSTRPKGGDLIWFPLDDRLYEIKDIEYAKPYYQLQNLYVYELYCELFRYQDEVIATGIDDIDNELLGDESDGLTDDGISTIQGITQTLTMVGTAVNATAVTGLVDGGVRAFTITNRGGGYGMVPTVNIGAAPSGGVTAVGIASMIGGINVCNLNANPRLQSVQRIDVANAGSGYTVAPSVTFSTTDGSGVGAAATATIGDGIVGVVTISNAGGGYVSAPLVTFESPIGPGAAATVTVSAAGTVTAVTIDNGGAHYNPSSPPTVTFSTPLDRINGVTSLIPSSVLPRGSNFTSGVYTTTNVSLGATGTGLTLDVTVNGSGAVTAAEIADPGQHYANGNVVTITNGLGGASGTVSFSVVTAENIDGVTATGIASVSSAGIVTSISITNAGVGYHSGATVSIANTVGDKVFGSDLVVATGRALISAAGTITDIHLTNAGAGYTVAPTVSIAAPPSGSNAGNFAFNEIVTGSTSNTTARVRSWDSDTNVLEVGSVSGSFSAGETLTGSTSGATRVLRVVDKTVNNDPYADNYDIENEADAILDFTEQNPFGMP